MFTSDFAQLPPVMGKPLYATHDLTPEETMFQRVYQSFYRTIDFVTVPFPTAVVTDTSTFPGPGPSPATESSPANAPLSTDVSTIPEGAPVTAAASSIGLEAVTDDDYVSPNNLGVRQHYVIIDVKSMRHIEKSILQKSVENKYKSEPWYNFTPFKSKMRDYRHRRKEFCILNQQHCSGWLPMQTGFSTGRPPSWDRITMGHTWDQQKIDHIQNIILDTYLAFLLQERYTTKNIPPRTLESLNQD
ncbi:hypothetical protein KCU77_g1926, partial [Aureobasidium melanogenum]